ncbi:MAG TPA: hypothetical protein VFH78_05715 [Candidatus Thermoplasmatota archaeon]|nr:hypothetical protein [Candidatus Thermoplasmatota archaeon]
MRGAPLLLALALLAPLALAQSGAGAWTQPGGSPSRGGFVDGHAWPLDVVASTGLLRESEEFAVVGGLPLVDAGGALFGVATAGNGPALDILGALAPVGACALVRWTPGAEPSRASLPCAGDARVAGVAPAAGVVLVCSSGGAGDPIVQAWDARGAALRWSASPAPPLADGTTRGWWCDAASVEDDRGRVVVAFGSDDRNEVAALRLSDGSVLWRRVLPPPDLPSFAVGPDASTVPLGFGAQTITRLEGGYVVLGYTESRSGAIVIDDEGNVLRSVPEVTSPAPAGAQASPWAAARGPRAAFVLGGDIILADTSGNVQRRPLADVQAEPQAAPAWWSSTLLVPRERTMQRYDTGSLEPLWERAWSAPDGGSILDLVLVTPGSAAVLWREAGAGAAHLSRLELSSAAELQRIPLGEERTGGRIVPRADGSMLVTFGAGRVYTLGATPLPRPTVALSNAYPAVEEAVTLRVDAPGAARVLVAWGDGAVDEVTSGEATHQYQAERPRAISVTAVMPDGRTATTEVLARVGAPPPATLTAIQRAFAPERQELTFFVLGLALTGGGALFAAALRRRRHARLAQEEQRLRVVMDASLLTPTQGLAALEAHRAHLRDQHTRRRLDDAQYAMLDHRAVRAMKSARYRLLGASLNKLSPHFRRVLDTALEDGQVTSGEMAALVAAVEEEPALSADERERVRSLLLRWAR